MVHRWFKWFTTGSRSPGVVDVVRAHNLMKYWPERELPLDDDAQWSTSDDQSDSARRVSTWPPRVATSHTGLALNALAILGGRRLAPSRLKDAASAGTGSLLHPTQHAVLRQLRHLTIRLSRFPSHPQIGVGSLSSLPIS